MKSAVLLMVVALLASQPAQAREHLPRRVGQCVVTSVMKLEFRLEDPDTHEPVRDSGSAIEFTNGGYLVSYDTIPAVEASELGDPVRMCLVSIARGCPAGDQRGREYRVTNLRTHKSWRLPDAEHMCGGA